MQALLSNQDELVIEDQPTMDYLERQANIFEQLRSKLIANYLGQYIWLVDEQVMDTDRDFASLFDRAVKQMGDAPIFIRQVVSEVKNPIELFSPTSEKALTCQTQAILDTGSDCTLVPLDLLMTVKARAID